MTADQNRFFDLPDIIADLVATRNQLREHYKHADLRFTLDGNLVGDIGEAVAAELFGLQLAPASRLAIDGTASDGRTVQVKATGTARGPAFRYIEPADRADHLLFFSFDFENLQGEVVFNGPESIALRKLEQPWTGQRMLTPIQIRDADLLIEPDQRLPMIGSPER